MGSKTEVTPAQVKKAERWFRSLSVRERVMLVTVVTLITLVVLRLFAVGQFYLYYLTKIAHAAGLIVLGYKLTIYKSCAGLSLKTQELTAIYLIMKLAADFLIQKDMHIKLDTVTLVATLWVIFMMRFKLKHTYMSKMDNMPLYYVLVPCVIVGIVSHPHGPVNLYGRVLSATAMPVQAFTVLPQLRFIQNAKMVEPFTSHYVFALGVSRFVACATWVFQLIESGGAYLRMIGNGHLYILFVLLWEVVQTFILADFCYYYVKSFLEGHAMRLPSMV